MVSAAVGQGTFKGFTFATSHPSSEPQHLTMQLQQSARSPSLSQHEEQMPLSTQHCVVATGRPIRQTAHVHIPARTSHPQTWLLQVVDGMQQALQQGS